MIYYQKNRFHNDSIDIQNTAHHKKSHNQNKKSNGFGMSWCTIHDSSMRSNNFSELYLVYCSFKRFQT